MIADSADGSVGRPATAMIGFRRSVGGLAAAWLASPNRIRRLRPETTCRRRPTRRLPGGRDRLGTTGIDGRDQPERASVRFEPLRTGASALRLIELPESFVAPGTVSTRTRFVNGVSEHLFARATLAEQPAAAGRHASQSGSLRAADGVANHATLTGDVLKARDVLRAFRRQMLQVAVGVSQEFRQDVNREIKRNVRDPRLDRKSVV